jgi:hypothetical protein
MAGNPRKSNEAYQTMITELPTYGCVYVNASVYARAVDSGLATDRERLDVCQIHLVQDPPS